MAHAAHDWGRPAPTEKVASLANEIIEFALVGQLDRPHQFSILTEEK